MIKALILIDTPTAESDVQLLQKRCEEKKQELREIKEKWEGSGKIAEQLLGSDQLKGYFKAIEVSAKKAPWLVKAISKGRVEDLSSKIALLRKEKVASIEFDGSDEIVLNEDFQSFLEEKAQTRATCSSFTFDPSENDQKLSRFKIGGKSPESQSDFETILDWVKIKDCIRRLQECGCSNDDVYSESGDSYRSEFLSLLEEGLHLEELLQNATDEMKQELEHCIEMAPVTSTQARYEELLGEIQGIEADLVFKKVVLFLKKRLTASAVSNLKALSQMLKNMNVSAVAGKSSSERGSRHFGELTAKFKEAAKYMPFLVMTVEQVSNYLPPNHTCDLGIIDEASQSSSSAIVFMARCNQMLVVGDDKQVSPSQCNLSEGTLHALKQHLPKIPNQSQLLPESSFFDLCLAAFPFSEVSLTEHFRCHPDIIAISNAKFYAEELIPLRAQSKQAVALVDNYFEHGSKDSKSINEVEAQAIAKRVSNEIKDTSNKPDFKTIMVVSLGGAKQHKRIKELVDEMIDDLKAEFGSDTVDRHKILYGTSSECQGAERDIVLLSAVHSPGGGKGKLVEDNNWKAMNVALTRAKDKMELFRSYSLKNLKGSDMRCDVLRAFINANARNRSRTATTGRLLFDPSPMVVCVEGTLTSALERCGYKVHKHGGKIWPEAFMLNLWRGQRLHAPSFILRTEAKRRMFGTICSKNSFLCNVLAVVVFEWTASVSSSIIMIRLRLSFVF